MALLCGLRDSNVTLSRLPISHRDRHRRVPLHEPIRGKALDRPAGAAIDDEVGQDSADHRSVAARAPLASSEKLTKLFCASMSALP